MGTSISRSPSVVGGKSDFDYPSTSKTEQFKIATTRVFTLESYTSLTKVLRGKVKQLYLSGPCTVTMTLLIRNLFGERILLFTGTAKDKNRIRRNRRSGGRNDTQSHELLQFALDKHIDRDLIAV